jgi:hypothetical protein
MKILISAGIFLALLSSVAMGQGKTDLDQLEEKISSHIQSQFAGWRHKRVEPFSPSSNTLVQFWSLPNRTVKVSVAIRESAEDAKKELQSFLQFKQERKQLTGIGDEAFASGLYDSTIAFRRGRYVVYVSTVVHIEDDVDGRNLSEAELETRRKSEVQRITREFAKQLSSIKLH